MKIECRERTVRSPNLPGTPWGDWEMCEGTEGLTLDECKRLVKQWKKDDADTHWLRIEYRIVEE